MRYDGGMLQYHVKTFELVGEVPRVSQASLEELSRLEQLLGKRLPPSLVEWYSLGGACDLLRRYSNGDPPVPIAELGRDRSGGITEELARDNLLVFRHENQGVCTWAVKLDGSDDPPVIVDYDTGFREHTLCAPSFSSHVYSWVWDYTFVLHRELTVQAQNGPLSGEAWAFLRAHFAAGPETHGWPGRNQYRFEGSNQWILIWADDKQADWWLAAEDSDDLARLIESVWDVDQVGRSLWSHREEGELILRRIRNARMT